MKTPTTMSMLDKKLIAIFALTFSAAALLVVNIWPAPARADNVSAGRDFVAVTASVPATGEAVYIVDNRTGRMAVYTYDPASRQLVLRDARDMADAFQP